jgi:hypothetical protein
MDMLGTHTAYGTLPGITIVLHHILDAEVLSYVYTRVQFCYQFGVFIINVTEITVLLVATLSVRQQLAIYTPVTRVAARGEYIAKQYWRYMASKESL